MAKAKDKKIQYSIFDGMLQTISSKKEQLTQEQFDDIKYSITQASTEELKQELGHCDQRNDNDHITWDNIRGE